MAKKVFFVDDEIVIRENIRACIDWEKEGFDYCGDAPDGEYALPLIEEHRPDILITDIKMPFMNGLELSAIVRKRLPDTKIVLLSGHDEFEYARQALRLGVEDYCLKPFGSADIIQLLYGLSDKIDREAAHKAKLESLAQSLTVKEQDAREQLIAKLCGGFIASAEACEWAAELGIPLIARHYGVVVTDIRPQEAGVMDPGTTAAAEAGLEALLSRHVSFLQWKRSRSETVWVLQSESLSVMQALLQLLPEAVKTLEQNHFCAVSFGLGTVQDRLQGVHASFLDAEEDKYGRKLAEQHRSHLMELSASSDGGMLLDRESFIAFLASGASRRAEEEIRKFAAGLQSIDWHSSLLGYFVLSDATFEAIRKARALFRASGVTQEAIERLNARIHAVKSWDEALAYLTDLAELFWKWRAESAGKYGELIAQVKAFVQTNYAQEGLSLQDAADRVSVSPSHLSKVFSQETGGTFIEFLMMTRIRKAMELLRSTNEKSYEIAHRVGYNDPHYFSNLFKRVTGMTIREYRKQGGSAGDLGEGTMHVS